MWRLKLPLVVIAVLLLQTTVLLRVRGPDGVVPDAMLLLAVAGGVVGGSIGGAITGFFAGIAIDLFLQTPLGLSALVFTFVGYGVGFVSEGVLHSAAWLRVLTVAVGSALGEALFALTGAILGQPWLVGPRLGTVVAMVAVVNAVLTPVALPVVGWTLQHRLPAAGGAARWT
jgi:rod shape-determining protein MreD